jgi:hypothetical protein
MLMSYNREISNLTPGLYTRSDMYFSARDIGTILSSDYLFLGIDKFKVFWIPSAFNQSHDLWSKATLDMVDGATRRNALLDVGFGEAILRFSSGNPNTASVEFNPSAILNADRNLATLAEACTALGEVLRLAREFVSLPPKLSDYGLSRIDLTVDFEPVSDMQHLLKLCAQSRAFRNTTPNIRPSHLTDEIESVSFNTRSSGSVLFYDKSAERNEDGRRFRVEVSLERTNLRRIEQLDLTTLSEDILRAAFRRRLTNFIEACLQDRSSKVDEILQKGEHTKTLITAAGYEYLKQHGHHPKKTKHWFTKYSKFKKLFPHITIGDLL